MTEICYAFNKTPDSSVRINNIKWFITTIVARSKIMHFLKSYFIFIVFFNCVHSSAISDYFIPYLSIIRTWRTWLILINFQKTQLFICFALRILDVFSLPVIKLDVAHSQRVENTLRLLGNVFRVRLCSIFVSIIRQAGGKGSPTLKRISKEALQWTCLLDGEQDNCSRFHQASAHWCKKWVQRHELSLLGLQNIYSRDKFTTGQFLIN